MLNRCESCEHYGKTHGDCMYLEHTGKLRSLICNPGNECTVYVRRKEARCGKPVTWDVVKGYYLYMEGKSFKEIAAAVDATPGSVNAYAHKYWPDRKEEKESEEEDMKKLLPVEPETAVDPVYTYQPDTVAEPVKAEPSASAELQQLSDPLPTVAAPTPKQMTRLDLLEQAIGSKTGVDAYLTGHAMACLINWQFVDDLYEARDAIDLMIKRLKS